jgi:hypothetical protein
MDSKQGLDIIMCKTRRSRLENNENTVGVHKIDANQKWRKQCSANVKSAHRLL